ncbi:hypothetical protein F2Q68_00033387 [Brassica cretica]|uniref:Tim44-like domain-containing protein n=1 Tax=Brassica cretica TaxID=69181 RepID=A0A8S9H1Z3_BRACR|nr:hypothetical protein F2Q68_00033387 [Brassica cretica]
MSGTYLPVLPNRSERETPEEGLANAASLGLKGQIASLPPIGASTGPCVYRIDFVVSTFQTQEIFCVRDKKGNIREGGQDTIHSVYYKWAMQQVEAGEESMYPIWRLRDICKLGAAQALI